MKKLVYLFSYSLLFISAICQADIDRFTSVSAGIYRGGQPETLQDYNMLLSYGVKSILNLRTTSSVIKNERKISEKLNINFKSIPLSGVLPPSDSDIKKALEFMTNPNNQPVFVHCHYGKDRTGLVIALYRVFFEGWTPDSAYDEMIHFGFSKILFGLSHYFWDRTEDYPKEKSNQLFPVFQNN